MKISITGKHFNISDSFREHVETTLGDAVTKYFSNAMEATVVVSRDAHLLRANLSVHVGQGILLQGHADATEPHAAFDAAVDKVAKRLRRHKRRLRDHHKKTPLELESHPAQQYVLSNENTDDAGNEEGDEADANEADNPVIVAEMATRIETLTVGEAVMRLDLADLPAVMFRNRAHGGFNMIYRRSDGNISWVDPDSGKDA